MDDRKGTRVVLTEPAVTIVCVDPQQCVHFVIHTSSGSILSPTTCAE